MYSSNIDFSASPSSVGAYSRISVTDMFLSSYILSPRLSASQAVILRHRTILSAYRATASFIWTLTTLAQQSPFVRSLPSQRLQYHSNPLLHHASSHGHHSYIRTHSPQRRPLSPEAASTHGESMSHTSGHCVFAFGGSLSLELAYVLVTFFLSFIFVYALMKNLRMNKTSPPSQAHGSTGSGCRFRLEY